MRCKAENKPIKFNWTWEEWQSTRQERRAIARSIGPATTRRTHGSADRRLRKAFHGARGPAFSPAEK